jgi:hypothetical protein
MKTFFIYHKPLRIFTIAAAGISISACGGQVPATAPWATATEHGIIRGQSVKPSEDVAKSIVALVAQAADGEALCTGSILTKDTILTAAHCVDHEPARLMIVFSTDVRAARPEQMRRASAFAQHPRWHAPSGADGRGDLALIHFEGGLPQGYQPVRVAPKNWRFQKGEETLAVGYGVNSGLRAAGSGRLRETWTTMLGFASNTEIVTDGAKSSVCFGDSGGPAFIQREGALVQWGIASAVMNRACDKASIHTNIAPYADWIKSTTLALRRQAARS